MSAPHAVIEFPAGPIDLRPLNLAFGAPRRELYAWTGAEVRAVVAEVEALAREGFWCVGYLRYEAASAFEPSAAVHDADGPLAYFSVHRKAVELPRATGETSTILEWQETTTRSRFDENIARIHAAIARGEVYQVNYTSALHSRYEGDLFGLHCALRRAQPNANAAYLANEHEAVLSVSPELFFDWDGEVLQCRPMKGTAARGVTADIDRANAEHLRTSAKERAENVMIVDLLRNDMSRVAQLGSVQVPRVFECEPWPTVWQMTSTVVARTRSRTTLLDILRALFPCGSVTGAPKLRAMHWIRQLEPGGRGIYCGAVGVVQPGGAARFNVPIRTVTVRRGQATCGIGSGITAGSSADGEWAEWTHKRQFLELASQPFQLLQTIRVEAGVAHYLELHLDRLVAAGAHFGYPVDRDAVRAAVMEAAGKWASRSGRVRVTVNAEGAVTLGVTDLPQTPAGSRAVLLASRAVTAPPAFLRHKTTRRGHLEPFAADTPDAFDTLLWNERGEVTEFTRGNVILERPGGDRVTPPLQCGLLDGVGRAHELASGRVREDVVRLDELRCARRIWFVNALRGLLPVHLSQQDA